MAHGLLGILRHQPLELALGALVFGMGRSGLAEQSRKRCPGIGSVHVDHPDRFDAGLRGFAVEQRGGFARLHRPPESLFSRNQDRLVDRVGFNGEFNPLAAAIDDGEHGFLGARDQHVVLELGHVFFSRPLF